jgi:hypothetical protein
MDSVHDMWLPGNIIGWPSSNGSQECARPGVLDLIVYTVREESLIQALRRRRWLGDGRERMRKLQI